MSRLYIKRNAADGWHEVVTDSKEDVRFTFTFDNLSNPTNYVSERSVSAKLPRCPENDIFFGHVCRLDSIAHGGDGYDPATKMQYIAMDSAGMIVSEGDAVINEVMREYYSLSLLGTQSAIFSRALNAGWSAEKAANDLEYYLMADPLQLSKNGTTFNTAVNKLSSSFIQASWRVDNPLFDIEEIKRTPSLVTQYSVPISETEAWIVSLIGWAPTLQGKYPNFSNDKWRNRAYINGEQASKANIIPVLSRYTSLDGTPADGYKVEGTIYEQQLGEFRSYYQQPYIYMSALWQLMASEFKAITGYNLMLDQRWFNPSNPELGRMIYMLPQKPIEETLIGETALSSVTKTMSLPVYSSAAWREAPAYVPGIENVNTTLTTETVHVNAGEKVTFHYSLSAILNMLPVGTGFTFFFNNINPFYIQIKLGYSVIKEYLIINTTNNSNFNLNKNAFINTQTWYGALSTGVIADNMRAACVIITSDYGTISGGSQTAVNICDIVDEVTVQPNASRDFSLSAVVSLYSTTDYSPFMMLQDEDDDFTWGWYNFTTAPQLNVTLSNVSVRRYKNDRSYRPLTMDSIFGDIAPFDVLLQYAKAHNLVWDVDTLQKQVRVRRSCDAFSDYMDAQALDITENVSSDATIKPLSWENKSVLFNMGDMETDYTEGYKDRVGVPYGSKRLVTVGNVAKGEKALFEGNMIIKASAVASLTAAPVSAIMRADALTIIEGRPTPINVKGEESANVSGNFYYRHNNISIGNDPLMGGWRNSYVLSDDSGEEIREKTYCWHGSAYSYDKYINLLPHINTVSDSGLSVLFAPVREVYTLTPDVATSYLYERAWQGYTEEVYNIQNKTVETLVYLPRNIFDRVRRNPLVIIDHVLYIVTEIRSWSEHNTTVRCKMRQITNINNLTS